MGWRDCIGKQSFGMTTISTHYFLLSLNDKEAHVKVNVRKTLIALSAEVFDWKTVYHHVLAKTLCLEAVIYSQVEKDP